jgi:hypothetical protein
MKKAVVILSLTLILVLGTVTPFIKLERGYAQAAYQQQRLGTTNILKFPDVHLMSETGKTTILGLQFILSGNTTTGTNKTTTNSAAQSSSTVIAFKNPDYGLNNSTNAPKLSIGKSFVVSEIPYSKVNVKLVPVLSGTDPTAEDPEDMMLGQPINLGSHIGNFGNFSIPHNVQPGKYILYAYLQFPSLHATGIYNGQVMLIQQQLRAAAAMPATTNAQTTGGRGGKTVTSHIIHNTINTTTTTTTNSNKVAY